jgi:hypothetical protein
MEFIDVPLSLAGEDHLLSTGRASQGCREKIYRLDATAPPATGTHANEIAAMRGRRDVCQGLKLPLLCLLALLGLATTQRAAAEPYLALTMGLKCSACHVSPTGGGMRNTFGSMWGQTALPARSFGVTQDSWTGEVNRHVALGADVRGGLNFLDQPGTKALTSFDVTSLHAYLDLRPIPEMMALYIDERIAPGDATNAEAYLRMWTPGRRLYVKAGQLYLPYGIRLQDDGAFTREATGISFNTPDRGVEFGFDGARWTAQLAITNGTASGSEVNNGKQWSLRSEYVAPRWRAGASLNLNDQPGGTRRMQNLFGGLRTGPVVWLGEVDYIVDGSIGPTRKQWAGLVEADWKIAPGQNLKLTAERFDPDRSVARDHQTRLSLVWEYTPLPFVQLRAGVRNYDDIEEVAFFNRRIAFLQLHGYL